MPNICPSKIFCSPNKLNLPIPQDCPTVNYFIRRQSGHLSRVIASQTESRASGETSTLCRESSSAVSILLSVPILALIGQSETKCLQPKLFITPPSYHILHVCTDEQCLWWSTFLDFKGTGRNFPCRV